MTNILPVLSQAKHVYDLTQRLFENNALNPLRNINLPTPSLQQERRTPHVVLVQNKQEKDLNPIGEDFKKGVFLMFLGSIGVAVGSFIEEAFYNAGHKTFTKLASGVKWIGLGAGILGLVQFIGTIMSGSSGGRH